MRAMSPRERKLVALLILVAVVALVLALVLGPLVDGFAARAAQRQGLIDTFHANERRIASLDALARAAGAQDEELRARLIAAPDPDEAGEALRAQIESAAEAAGAQVKASEAAAAEGTRARAAVEARMGHAQLAALLAALNRVQPALAVDAVTVIADDALTNPKSDLLDVRIEASAPFVPSRAG